MNGSVLGILLLLIVSGGIQAAPYNESPRELASPEPANLESAKQPVRASSRDNPISYDEYSDAELTELGSQWEDLSAPQRRALLAEVKMRMARDRGRSGILKIRTTRQYGVVRKADGTTVRVERRVVRVVPVAPSAGGQVTFGMGFERRNNKAVDGSSDDEARLPGDAKIERPPVLRASGRVPSEKP